MEKQFKLDLDLLPKNDDLLIIYSQRQVIRKAFDFWKEIDSLKSPSLKKSRSSSDSSILNDLNRNEESIQDKKSAKSVSYQNLDRFRKNGKSTYKEEEENENNSKTISTKEKHKKFKTLEPPNTSKTVKKKHGKQKSLTIFKPPVETSPLAPRSVEVKRRAYAIKRQVAVSPHSPENPIKDMRGRLLGKLKKDDTQITSTRVELPKINIEMENKKDPINSPSNEIKRSRSKSPKSDDESEHSDDNRKKKRKHKSSSAEFDSPPKLLSLSSPTTPENSDSEDNSPKIHRRKRLARRSSTGNEITHLGKRPPSVRIEKRDWILESKPAYRKRSSTKFSKTPESKEGKNLIMKTLESFFRTRNENLRSSRKQIFNIPLDTCVPINSEAPTFVIEACNNIRNADLTETFNDVFEMNSMTDKDMLVIRKSIEDQHIDITTEKDTKIVAYSLLIFFIDLSDSLCTSKHYDNFLYLADINNSSYRFRLAHSLIHSIPATNRLTLKYLANFVTDISNGDEDKLTKLTNFLAPSIFRSKQQANTPRSSTESLGISYQKILEKSSKNNKASTVFKYIVNNRKKLFKLSFKDKKFVLLRGKLVLESSTFPEMINVLLDEFYNDNDYADIFFLNYHQFTSSLDLLKTFLDIYDKNAEDREYCKRRRIKILMVLRMWFKSYGDTLCKNDKFLSLVYEYTFEKPHLTKEEESLWNDLYSTLNVTCTIGMAKIKKLKTPHLAEIVFKSKITDFKPSKVAKAITLLDLENFKAIDSKECLNKAFCDSVKGKNFFNMASQFNRINLWVQTLIVQKPTVKERVYLIHFFGNVIECLLEFNNFNGALAIYSALTSTSISRLNKSWSKVSRKVLRLLEVTGELFSFDRNYKNYYLKLNECVLPIIPQIAIISRNLFAIEENMESIENNLINIEKMRSIYSIIVDIKKYQKSEYSFTRNNTLISYLRKINPLTEEEILDISENLEKKQTK